MNERIQELAEQAGFYVADGKIYIPSTSEEITTCQKKFAELIVLECADFVAQNTLEDQGMWGKIVRHFGVEE
jgi:hypothetical protein